MGLHLRGVLGHPGRRRMHPALSRVLIFCIFCNLASAQIADIPDREDTIVSEKGSPETILAAQDATNGHMTNKVMVMLTKLMKNKKMAAKITKMTKTYAAHQLSSEQEPLHHKVQHRHLRKADHHKVHHPRKANDKAMTAKVLSMLSKMVKKKKMHKAEMQRHVSHNTKAHKKAPKKRPAIHHVKNGAALLMGMVHMAHQQEAAEARREVEAKDRIRKAKESKEKMQAKKEKEQQKAKHSHLIQDAFDDVMNFMDADKQNELKKKQGMKDALNLAQRKVEEEEEEEEQEEDWEDDGVPFIRQTEVEADTDDSKPLELSSQAKHLLANLIHTHKKAASGTAKKVLKSKKKHNIVHQAVVNSDDVADKAAGHKVSEMRDELKSDLRVGHEGLERQKADLQKDVVAASAHTSAVVAASAHTSADAKASAIAAKLFQKLGGHSMSAANLRVMIQKHLWNSDREELKPAKMKVKLHTVAEEILEDLNDARGV